MPRKKSPPSMPMFPDHDFTATMPARDEFLAANADKITEWNAHQAALRAAKRTRRRPAIRKVRKQ